MAVMTVDEREKFLAEKRVGVLSIGRDGAAPLAVPVWYDYEPGGELLIWMDRGSAKDRAIEASGKLSLTVQQETQPYKYVTVSGPVVDRSSAPTEEQALAIASRYASEANAREFVEGSLKETSVLVRVRTERWLSSDHSK
ncbi:pyridoxamine 5'-phosphate oxidase family protein [Amycolatopsis circi]|uniref:pyridoxamine 5'-phosphate oxidase family protein n=1 Tax=Amycolatopsis circi TaxID=871959 RepID=UPI000E23DAC0|nr:pyridoxamine 5'-phosphate oxidase family protein [Amycolatopsis circi]